MQVPTNLALTQIVYCGNNAVLGVRVWEFHPTSATWHSIALRSRWRCVRIFMLIFGTIEFFMGGMSQKSCFAGSCPRSAYGLNCSSDINPLLEWHTRVPWEFCWQLQLCHAHLHPMCPAISAACVSQSLFVTSLIDCYTLAMLNSLTWTLRTCGPGCMNPEVI